MQYEDFKLIVKYRGVGNVSEHVYNLVKKHHSVRKFKNKPLSEDVVKKLVEAGQSASTSSFLQAYSIIGIDDEKIKENLREVSGQPYVVENGYLFVFVIDYYRHHLVDQHAETDMENAYGSTEGLLVGAIDAALVAENIAVTAEDMGYGIVFLGSLRNDVERVREILDLPDYVFPVFGMAVGNPQMMKMVQPSHAYHLTMSSIIISIMLIRKHSMHKWQITTRQSASTMINVQTGIAKKHGHSKLRCS